MGRRTGLDFFIIEPLSLENAIRRFLGYTG